MSNADQMQWYACDPDVLGEQPPPSAGHHLALVGKTLLYAVGGEADLYVLDISTHTRQIASKFSSKRSFSEAFVPIPVNESGPTSTPFGKGTSSSSSSSSSSAASTTSSESLPQVEPEPVTASVPSPRSPAVPAAVPLSPRSFFN